MDIFAWLKMASDAEPSPELVEAMEELWEVFARAEGLPLDASPQDLSPAQTAGLAAGEAFLRGRMSVKEFAGLWVQAHAAYERAWVQMRAVVMAAKLDGRSEYWIADKLGMNRRTVRRMLSTHTWA